MMLLLLLYKLLHQLICQLIKINFFYSTKKIIFEIFTHVQIMVHLHKNGATTNSQAIPSLGHLFKISKNNIKISHLRSR
jgi:hypothetical protein